MHTAVLVVRDQPVGHSKRSDGMPPEERVSIVGYQDLQADLPEYFLHHTVHIRQRRSVSEVRESLITDYRVEFHLGLVLNFRILEHADNESHQ